MTGKELIKQVETHVVDLQKSNMLDVPKDYSAVNAIRAAQLILGETMNRQGKPVLTTCTQASIANSILKMVTDGLSPLKSQGAFIARGNKLTWQREYFGKITLARRHAGMVGMPKAAVIRKGDKVELKTVDGVTRVVSHDTEFANQDAEILGAYCVVNFKDGTDHHEVMTIKQITAAWEQGDAKGKSPAHTKFPEEMAKKTVIGRALKNYINSSDDSAVVSGEGGYGETDDDGPDEVVSLPAYELEEEETETEPEPEPEPKPEADPDPEPKPEQKKTANPPKIDDSEPDF